MKLINTDGMAFIGPGSEWFWTAVSGIVLAVTFIAIWRQLSMARSESARQQLDGFNRQWDSERLLRHQLELFAALRDGADRAHLPAGSTAAIANFWETIAQLARSGHQDVKALHTGYGPWCQEWWATLAPTIQRLRVEHSEARLAEHFEWLAGRMAELDRRAGHPPFDAAAAASSAAAQVTAIQDLLRVEVTLRSVITASPEAVPPAPLAAAVASQS